MESWHRTIPAVWFGLWRVRRWAQPLLCCTRRIISKKARYAGEAAADVSRDLMDKGRDLYDKGRKVADEAADLFERGRRLVEG